jgi:hypothetical protein
VRGREIGRSRRACQRPREAPTMVPCMVPARAAFAFGLALGLVVPACGARDLPPPLPGPAPPPPHEVQAAPSFQPAAVEPVVAGQGTIVRVERREQVGLTGPRVEARPGDWLLENGQSVAVVAADGRVVDLGTKGGRDELGAINPTAFLGLDAAHVEVVSVEPVGEGGRVLHVVRRVLEKPLLLHELISFSGEVLRVETAITAASPAGAQQVVTLGERIDWSNVPTWAEGHGFVTRSGVFASAFVGRDSYGVAYALCSEGGRLMARFDAPESGFHEGPVTGEVPESVPAGAPGSRRVVFVGHASGSLGKAATALPCRGPGQHPLRFPQGLPPSARVEVARCHGGMGRTQPAPYARFRPDEVGVTLPDGCFVMRSTAPGHTATSWYSIDAAVGVALPPAGAIRFAVTEKGSGKPLPARVLVRGIKGTPDPDWGDDPDEGAALDVVYSDTGSGERPLPPGKYRVTVDRGFEYTAYEKELDVEAGHAASVSVELARVVDTKGWIAADLHLHAMPSPDAIQPLADRVRALVATGVEVGVATDHNKVTDYRPVIAELKLGSFLASIVGDEITTREPAWGHFNVFPLREGSEPLRFRGTSPKAILADAKAAGPLGAETIVQVNHPRMARIGYFDLLRFDRDDVKGWRGRVPLGELGFDAIEVFNGDHYAMIPEVEECMRDWYALLEAGFRVTATGNSDSHKLTFHEPGVPRNLVAVPNDDPAAFDERAFVAAVRQGKVVVSSGPFIVLTAGGKGVGETVRAGEVEIVVQVDAPPWVDVDRVELVRRGELMAAWSAPFPAGPHRFEAHLKKKLVTDDWIVAIARGTKPMTYLHRPNARPFAFTNPVWVE